RARPRSLVGLILSALRDLFLWFFGGLVPRPLFELALEPETVALRRDRPRTMARRRGSGGSPVGRPRGLLCAQPAETKGLWSGRQGAVSAGPGGAELLGAGESQS